MIFLIVMADLKILFLQRNLSFDPSIVAAFIAFFTLLEGSAVGFLISQPWHLFYDFFLRQNSLHSARKFLQRQDRYKLIDKYQRMREQTVFLDYLIHMADKQILTYLQRRWDLLHTIGSTLMAVLVGSLVGFIFRVSWLKAEFWNPFDYFVIVAFPFFVLILICSYRIVNSEHDRMALAAVRNVWYSGRFTPEDAKRVFPKEYFQQDSQPAKKKEESV